MMDVTAMMYAIMGTRIRVTMELLVKVSLF